MDAAPGSMVAFSTRWRIHSSSSLSPSTRENCARTRPPGARPCTSPVSTTPPMVRSTAQGSRLVPMPCVPAAAWIWTATAICSSTAVWPGVPCGRMPLARNTVTVVCTSTPASRPVSSRSPTSHFCRKGELHRLAVVGRLLFERKEEFKPFAQEPARRVPEEVEQRSSVSAAAAQAATARRRTAAPPAAARRAPRARVLRTREALQRARAAERGGAERLSGWCWTMTGAPSAASRPRAGGRAVASIASSSSLTTTEGGSSALSGCCGRRR